MTGDPAPLVGPDQRLRAIAASVEALGVTLAASQS